MRIKLKLSDKGEWVRVFDPRDTTIFVAMDAPPSIGSLVRVDLLVGEGGPKVILRGKIIARRLQGDVNLPKGCNVALGKDEREKVNYLNGFVRGGLLNLRETRRLPIRLKVTYGGMKGSIKSFTRDINEQGVFVVADDPLPEESSIHLFINFPGHDKPFALSGTVSHTVVVEDEDVPGMGIRFEFKDDVEASFVTALDALEAAFLTGKLDDKYLV